MDQVFAALSQGVIIINGPPLDQLKSERTRPLLFGAQVGESYHTCRVVITQIVEEETCPFYTLYGWILPPPNKPANDLDIPLSPRQVKLRFNNYTGQGMLRTA